jgi:hypothetical protein
VRIRSLPETGRTQALALRRREAAGRDYTNARRVVAVAASKLDPWLVGPPD